MADVEHLQLLQQGIDDWNKWRRQYPATFPNLVGADLKGADLSTANLSNADLIGADLKNTNLNRSILVDANLSGADLSGADLSGANLKHADFSGAILSRTDLRTANLGYANLTQANLAGADLTSADLTCTVLNETDLHKANFSYTRIGWTIFGVIDFRAVEGLGTTKHIGPSTIGMDTIICSEGAIPDSFLHNAGMPDIFINYIRSLINRPVEYYTCFISYSSKDEAFAERLHADLLAKGVRCWFGPEDMRIGDEIRTCIDESIHLYDKLLLVLSEHSIGSTWVKKEVETAFEKEARTQKPVLFPIRLDNAVMQTEQAWASDIRRMRHIGDFRHWKYYDGYQRAFTRLMRDLQSTTVQQN